MDAVGTALGHKCDLSGRRSAFIGPIIRGGDAELLHRIECDRQDGGEGIAVLIVGRDAIDRDVALIAVGAVDGSASGIDVFVDALVIAGISYARLQAEQIRNVAALQRQLLDLILIKGVAQRCVRGVDGFRLRRDFHLAGDRPNLEFHRHRIRHVHQKFKAGPFVLREALFFRSQSVSARRQSHELILSRIIGVGCALQALSGIHQCDLGADDRCAAGIEHDSTQRACARLPPGHRRGEQNQAQVRENIPPLHGTNHGSSFEEAVAEIAIPAPPFYDCDLPVAQHTTPFVLICCAFSIPK